MVRAHACDRCKRRKAKCNGTTPCSHCTRADVPCERQAIFRRPGPRVAKRPAVTNEGLQLHRELHRVDNDLEPTVTDGDILQPPSIQTDVTVHDSPETTWTNRSAGLVTPIPTVHTPGSVDVAPGSPVWSEFLQIRARLNSHFTSSPTLYGEIEDVAHTCIDLFLLFLFPNTPIAHEPTLRASIPLLSADAAALSPAFADDLSCHTSPTIGSVRRFTLITALCAHIISVVPETLSKKPKSLSVIFFDASKSMLKAYEPYDLEHPDSTSLTIRMWHSSCAQNTTGQIGASWHYHMEACCLAQRLRLFNEASISRPSVLESQLLRANFWHLYLAEKTQVAFRSRPPIIDERICDGEFNLLEQGDNVVPFLSNTRKENQDDLESRIMIGFHLRRRISATAAALIDDIAGYSRLVHTGSTRARPPNSTDIEICSLLERYVNFTALVNEVPPWVMHPDIGENWQTDDDQVRAYQVTCFWAQRSNIMTIFHCMRLLILQACIDHKLPVVVGLSENPLTWASRKLEIIRDFLHDLQGTPFICLEAQGETTASGILLQRLSIVC